MKAITQLFKKVWFLSLLGAIALAVIGILLGPHVDIAGYRPLFSWTARILFALVLLLIWGLFVLLAMLRGQKKDQEMVEDLAEDAKAPETDGADDEIESLSAKMADAMSTLREQARKGRLGRQFLYELPWYIVIGPPKAGKTTALVNSGLRFPLEEETGGKEVKGTGGTLDCDWWFTDNAVLLDTAGRYTVQDYARETTRKAWLGFLELLKKHRPRRPINGIIVAISLQELLEHDSTMRAAHAEAIRARIHELYDTLGVRFPIYFLFTKCDLVSGFVEFYDDLSKKESREVWGFTFPLQLQEDGIDEKFKDEYVLLMNTLTYHMFERLHNEESIERVSRIYMFPRQMSVVIDDLRDFIGQVFHRDRFHSMPWLRGVYFTSGTQEGNPIDRLVNEMLGETEVMQALPTITGKKGRSFFLTRFFEDILFREADIAGADPKSEKRRHWLQMGAYAASLAALLFGAATWHTAYQYNEARATEVGQLIARAQENIRHYDRVEDQGNREKSDSLDLEKWRAVLQILDPLYAASVAYERKPWYVAPLGLYKGVNLRGAAERAYVRALNRYFVPALLGAMEKGMRNNLDDLDVLYATLTSYRTFGNESMLEKLPERRETQIRDWFKVLWNYVLKHDRSARKELQQHLERLFKGRIAVSKLDESLILLVRRKIEDIPVNKRAFDFVVDHVDRKEGRDWVLDTELGFEGKKVFVSESGKGLEEWRIEALYTYEGFERLLETLPGLLEEFKEEQVGLFGTMQIDVGRLEYQVLSLYYSEFISKWEKMIQDLQLYKLSTYKDVVETPEILSKKPTSPLLNFVAGLERNTSLASRLEKKQEESGISVKVGSVGAISGKLQAAKSRLDAIRRSISVRDGGQAESIRLGMPVEAQFAELAKWARDEGGERPIDTPLLTMGSISSRVREFQRAYLEGANEIYKEEYRQALDAIDTLQDQSQDLPPPLKTWFAAVARDAREVLNFKACGQLNKLWAVKVFPLYERSIEGRFPVAKGSETDVKLADFKRFFGPGNELDKFLKQNLREGLDLIHSQEDMSPKFKELRVPASVYEQLHRAAVIKKMFFPYGSSEPGVSFDLTPEEMDPNLSTASLYFGAKKLVYRHDPPQTHTFQWPLAENKTIRLQFVTRDGRSHSRQYRGEWSLFRLFSDFRPQSIRSDEYRINISLAGYDFILRLSAESVDNPFQGVGELEQFRCPLQVCQE